jgi:hypothetical protein
MEQALQLAQTSMTASLATGVSWSSPVSTLDDTMMHRPLYTMWWVNGPLKLNQTIPVLVLLTNVTGTSNVDLGGTLGTRSAWKLAFNVSRPMLPPDSVATSPSLNLFGGNLELAFTFDYDQTSDLLLRASATVQLGFGEQTTIQPNPCNSSSLSTLCSATSGSITIMREFGIDFQASLKLTGTSAT